MDSPAPAIDKLLLRDGINEKKQIFTTETLITYNISGNGKQAYVVQSLRACLTDMTNSDYNSPKTQVFMVLTKQKRSTSFFDKKN